MPARPFDIPYSLASQIRRTRWSKYQMDTTKQEKERERVRSREREIERGMKRTQRRLNERVKSYVCQKKAWYDIARSYRFTVHLPSGIETEIFRSSHCIRILNCAVPCHIRNCKSIYSGMHLIRASRHIRLFISSFLFSLASLCSQSRR